MKCAAHHYRVVDGSGIVYAYSAWRRVDEWLMQKQCGVKSYVPSYGRVKDVYWQTREVASHVLL